LKFNIRKYDCLKNHVKESYSNKNNPSDYYIMHLEPNNKKTSMIYELTIPTCSYRMGVPEMGYGVLTMSKLSKIILTLQIRVFTI
jgi:hypothetical protein